MSPIYRRYQNEVLKLYILGVDEFANFEKSKYYGNLIINIIGTIVRFTKLDSIEARRVRKNQ